MHISFWLIAQRLKMKPKSAENLQHVRKNKQHTHQKFKPYLGKMAVIEKEMGI
jgi:hypothetical protein